MDDARRAAARFKAWRPRDVRFALFPASSRVPPFAQFRLWVFIAAEGSGPRSSLSSRAGDRRRAPVTSLPPTPALFFAIPPQPNSLFRIFDWPADSTVGCLIAAGVRFHFLFFSFFSL